MTFDPGQGGGGGKAGRCCPGGREVGVVRGVLSTPPPHVGQTDACENITFARFATRAVKIRNLFTSKEGNPRILCCITCKFSALREDSISEGSPCDRSLVFSSSLNAPSELCVDVYILRLMELR